MNRTLLLGALALALGIAGTLVPGVTAWVPAATSVTLFVAVGAVGAGAFAVRRRVVADPDRAELPARERYPDPPTPGTDFDAELADVVPYRSRADDRRQDRIIERLRGVAVAVLAGEGHSEERAEELLDTGEWTDDPVAAAFFTREDPRLRFDKQVRDLFDPTPAFVRRARRVVAVLDERTPDDGGNR